MKIVIKSFLIIDSNLKIDLIIDSIAPKQYVNEVQKCFKKTEKKILSKCSCYTDLTLDTIYTQTYTHRDIKKQKQKYISRKLNLKLKW